MKRVVNILETVVGIVSGHVAGWLVFIMMLIILAEVGSRYLLGLPLMFADEYASYAVVAITFIGLAYTWKEKGHIRITFLFEKLPAGARKWVRLVTVIVATGLTAILVKGSFSVVSYSFQQGVRSQMWLRTPWAWPQLVLVIGSVLLLLTLVVELIRSIEAVRAAKRGELR